MADVVSIVIIAVIAVSVVFLAWYTSRRHWNVAREDDAVREEGLTRLDSDDGEED